jgi:hypothetical protein
MCEQYNYEVTTAINLNPILSNPKYSYLLHMLLESNDLQFQISNGTLCKFKSLIPHLIRINVNIRF